MKIDIPKFIPHPFCRNSHLQTVLSLYAPTKYRSEPGEMSHIRTEDGDTIVIHENTPTAWTTGDRIAVLLHGLCGNHASKYMTRVSAKLIERGFKTIRIDMRGFGESLRVSRGHMHAGRSDDVQSVLNDTIRRYSGSPISLIGFSLGGNIVLKLLSELGDLPPAELDSAVVICPPIVLLTCTLNLQKGLNRFYDSYFAKLLAKAVRRRRKNNAKFDDVPLQNFPKRLYDFDDLYTAPATGFDSAEDYYSKCSTQNKLDQISVPTLLLIADDDPIVPAKIYESIHSPAIQKVVTHGGGHLGFFARKSDDPDRRWMDWRILDWITEAHRLYQEPIGPSAKTPDNN